MTRSKIVLGLCAAVALAGCVSFGAKPPKMLLTLNAIAPVPLDTTRVAGDGNSVTILVPFAPASVATVRVPVYDGATTLSYVKDAAWNETPARLFQRILSETVTAKTGKVVLDPRQYTADPGMRVSGQIERFGIDPAAMEAVVVFDAQIARAPGRIETRRFEARAPVSAIDAAVIGPPLNQAANKVASDVAAWIAG